MSKKREFMCAQGNCKTQCFTCSEDEKCDKKWGGTRKNAGAKPKYSEQTKTVAFRCPVSKVDELKLIVKSKLSEWSVKQQLTPGCGNSLTEQPLASHHC